jgi:hypothetical protein
MDQVIPSFPVCPASAISRIASAFFALKNAILGALHEKPQALDDFKSFLFMPNLAGCVRQARSDRTGVRLYAGRPRIVYSWCQPV